MATHTTEAMNEHARGLDALPPRAILSRLLDGQQAAAHAVEAALPAIEKASELAADALRAGKRLVYAGAGSSGLMAMADALELPGTYGITRDRIEILFAGGLDYKSDLPGGPEDDVELARADAQAAIAEGDCVIAISASGSTPYALGVAAVAREKGAQLVAIANNAGAPLFEGADVAILLATPPELVSGSTRMGAGTAQKIALNMFSTLTAVRLGHVFEGQMVNLRIDNIKLRQRAVRMVASIAGLTEVDAARFIDEAGGSVKAALLLASGAGDKASAEALLAGNNDNVRLALEALRRK